MLGKADYSLFLISPSSAGFNSSIFLTLHQLLKPRSSSCRWLNLISYSHPLPSPHAEAGHGAAAEWHRGGGEWVSAAGVVGGSPVAEHHGQGEGLPLLPWQKSPLGFILWLFSFRRQGFIPLSTKTKGSAQRKRGNNFNPKGCCVSLPIAC